MCICRIIVSIYKGSVRSTVPSSGGLGTCPLQIRVYTLSSLPPLKLGAGKFSASLPFHPRSYQSHILGCPHLQSHPSHAHPPHHHIKGLWTTVWCPHHGTEDRSASHIWEDCSPSECLQGFLINFIKLADVNRAWWQVSVAPEPGSRDQRTRNTRSSWFHSNLWACLKRKKTIKTENPVSGWQLASPFSPKLHKLLWQPWQPWQPWQLLSIVTVCVLFCLARSHRAALGGLPLAL